MMDAVTTPEVRELASTRGLSCISMYMPTYPREAGSQDELRLKNLGNAAEHELIKRGMRSVQAREFIAPILDLPRLPEWDRRKTGMAIFRSSQKFVHYSLSTKFFENLIVGSRFYVRPLLSVLNFYPPFIVLAISRNHVRALECRWDGHERLALPGLFTNIEDALNLQGADRGEQVHSAMRADLGKEAAVFHGQGGHRDTIKEETSEFFRLIDEALRSVLRQKPRPVILAGVDYEVAAYRATSQNPHITHECLHGGFDYVTDRQLYEQAVPIAKQICAAKTQQAISRYRSLLNHNRTSNDAEEILCAAHSGTIDTLFVDQGAELYGIYDWEKKSIELSPTRDVMNDLIELAALQTLEHGGTLHVATSGEMQATTPMCAILRY